MALDCSHEFFRGPRPIFLGGFREEFLHVHIVQVAPSKLCLLMDQISSTIFEKGHPRNISVKLFQNQTCDFGEEDFLRISSYLKNASRPHSTEPYLLLTMDDKQLMTHDGHRVILKAPLEYAVLR